MIYYSGYLMVFQLKSERYIINKMYNKEIEQYAKDILESDNFQMTKKHIQHGTMTVYEHCINVAKTCLWIRDKFGIKCDNRDLIRGALLHDYFLYDWHVGEAKNPLRLHGIFHPRIALNNAKKEYELTKRQEVIICRHMWPLTIIPPNCREGWLVTCADKYCSLMETLHFHQGNVERVLNNLNWEKVKTI